MKRHSTLAVIAWIVAAPLAAQISVGGTPYSLRTGMDRSSVPTVNPEAFDAVTVAAEDKLRDDQGLLPMYGRKLALNAGPATHGAWTELANGDRLWRLRIVSPGALATELFFEDMYLPAGALMHVYDDAGDQVIGGFTSANNKEHGLFTTSQLLGEACVVEYYEPLVVRGTGTFTIASVGHAYRFVGGVKAQDCEVDVNCAPEGTGRSAQRDGVVRVGVVEGGQLGWCSGSLVNNQTLDCKAYYLTAFHCGVNATASDFTAWKFYFRYQRSGCGTGNAPGGYSVTGCVKRADSNDGGGNSGSDFLLLEGEDAIPTNFNPYWQGWDSNTANPGSGAYCIHHPNGDEKKISTVNAISSSSQWNGVPAQTHWRVTWAGTTNGWGVTEGGSSGSPVFNSSGLIVGTLTGGGSYCNSVVPNGQLQPDYYGKLSYHWQSNGSIASRRLQNWLDPNNTGITSLAGSYGPCGTLGLDEAADAVQPALAPNPATDVVRVTLPAALADADRLEVLDVSGRLVMAVAVNGRGVLDISVSGLVPGLYMVTTVKGAARSSATRLNVVH